jgi:hypothetical protein
MPEAAAAAGDATLAPWAQLVLKDHVSLGGLTRPQLVQALALAWAALPAGGTHDERGINVQLKAVLQGAAVWMGTDHVELAAAAAPLQGTDVGAWVAQRRGARQAERAARRRAWEARQPPQGPA